MKREYRIYEKDGYTYVHYNGFPEGVRIEKNEQLYNYEWGWMTIRKNNNNNYYNIRAEDFSLFVNLLFHGYIIEEKGRYGMIDIDGKEILPCAFDQIEKLKNSVFGRLGDSYWEIFESGRSTIRADYSDTGFFVQNGKKGWQANGKTILPAKYDDIYHMDGSNFYQVLQNGKWFYVNKDGEPVLTYVREIKGVDSTVPFPFYTHEKDVIVLQEYVGHEISDDKNVVLLDGVWQRIDRHSGDELNEMFVNPNDEKVLTDEDMRLFNNDFSYEYAAYTVTSNDPSGAIDCLKKLQSMDLHSNTWHYIVKVWKPIGENPSAEELRFLRYQIEENGQLGKLHFALAHDGKLKKGETRMLVVTHYHERCWPPTWELDWVEERNELSLPAIKDRLKEIHRIIDEDVKEKYKDEVWKDQFWGGIYLIEYNWKRSWKETKEVLEYFKNHDSPILQGIRREAENASFTFTSSFNNSKRKCEFHYRKLKWLLENGADINAHFENKTALDILMNSKPFNEEDHTEYIESMKQKCIMFLKKHGAKTLQQIREEESKNQDYKVELDRMSSF